MKTKAMATPNARKRKRHGEFKPTGMCRMRRITMHDWNLSVERRLLAHRRAINKHLNQPPNVWTVTQAVPSDPIPVWAVTQQTWTS